MRFSNLFQCFGSLIDVVLRWCSVKFELPKKEIVKRRGKLFYSDRGKISINSVRGLHLEYVIALSGESSCSERTSQEEALGGKTRAVEEGITRKEKPDKQDMNNQACQQSS